MVPKNIFEAAGALLLTYLAYKVFSAVVSFLSIMLAAAPKQVHVELRDEEKLEKLEGYPKFDPKKLIGEQKTVYMWDPSTMDYFGSTPAMTTEQINETVKRGRVAQGEWKKSSFATRKQLMRTMLRYITENQVQCARVAVRDSGKTLLDALIGEVLVTCEKLAWLVSSGEECLVPEYRATGRMMMMKKVHVEFVPLGVIGAIVPWNYPFHNVFNPVSAALFSGNAIVIKVSEYASWSIRYYKAIIDACLDAVGAPRDLVQFVVGYGAAGAALVTSGVDKVIFVGSPAVGVMVARAAADNLTPVVLELGGKDPFVVCEDADVKGIIQTACRGVWQNMGQNCAGPERFFVYEKIFDEFCDGVTQVVRKMKIGPSLGDVDIDCGAICMGPRQMMHYQKLVDDAVIKGAKLLAGGFIPPEDSPLGKGSFYPPTILADIPENALIAQEEIFGPIMAIFKVCMCLHRFLRAFFHCFFQLVCFLCFRLFVVGERQQ
jgi:acyl-CoA reductase-like NAD-dependent aldehyde dehydrogenase